MSIDQTPASPAVKVIHLAGQINGVGDMSPICATRPRKINLEVETWTIRRDAVTCVGCRRLIDVHPDSAGDSCTNPRCRGGFVEGGQALCSECDGLGRPRQLTAREGA